MQQTLSAPTRAPVQPVHVRRRRRTALLGLAYASPTALVVGVLFLLPLAMLLWMSLNHWPLLGNPTLNAPRNYSAVLGDPLLADAVWFTVKYTLIVTVLLTAIAFGLALLVQERRPGVGLFRTVFFLPGAVGLASASLLFYGLLNDDAGPVGDLLRAIGAAHGPVSFLGTPGRALASSTALVVWRFAGFNMLILLTGLQAIPVEVYEAARMDGAGRWQTFRAITLPLMRPTIALMLILSITGSLLAFDQFYILTGGGPDNSTVTAVMVIVRQAFTRFDLGAAAALSVLVTAVLIAFNALQLRALRGGKDRP